MADIIGELVVQITGDNKGFNKSIDGAEKKSKSFEKSVTGMTKSLKGLIGGIGVAVIVKGIGDIATASIDAASDAEETSAKFLTAFQGIEDRATETAESLARDYGLATSESQKLLAGTGDLIKGFGANASEALNVSNRVQELSVDLASYNNLQGGASRASEILTKAYLGERDSLVSLGIKISEADVKQGLLEKGQEKLTGQSLMLARGNITLELAMKQSSDAIGDFARTSDSYANKTRIAEAAVKDLRVEMGRSLLPVATSVKSIFGELTGKLADYIREMNDLKEAQKAIDEGTDDWTDRLKVAENNLKLSQKELILIKNSIEQQIKLNGAAAASDIQYKKTLETRIAQGESAVSGIKRQIKGEADLKEEKAEQSEIDKANAQAREQQARADEQNYKKQIGFIGDLIDADKSELEIIEDQIKAIEDLEAQDEDTKKKQIKAVKLLEKEKDNILKTEVADNKKAQLEKLQAQKDFDTETRAILDQARTDKLAADQQAQDEIVATVNTTISLTRQAFEVIDSVVQESYGEATEAAGNMLSEIGSATGSMELQVAGAVISLVGSIATAYEDAIDDVEGITKDLAKSTTDTLDKNQREWLARSKDNRIKAAKAEEDAALEIFLATLTAQEVARLKTDGIIEESTLERLKREKEAAIGAGDEVLAGQLGNEIAIAEFRQTSFDEQEQAEKDYKNAIAELNYQQALADKEARLAEIKAARAVAVADLWWNDEARSDAKAAFLEAKASIQAIEIPPPVKLATGAFIQGSARGTRAIVGEAGDEEVFGMGSQGVPRRSRFANEVARIVSESMTSGGQSVTNNFYGKSLINRTELDQFARDLYSSNVREQQRRGM